MDTFTTINSALFPISNATAAIFCLTERLALLPAACHPDMASESVLLASVLAQQLYDGLRHDKTPGQLHDLGHGPVELLREVVGYIEISDDMPDLRQSLAAVQATLLLVRALLLGWDCPRFKEHMFEPPMPKLAKHWPNRQWQCKHPSKGTALREVQSCLKFMAENDPVFQEEPWLWLFDTLNGMELVLQLVLQSD